MNRIAVFLMAVSMTVALVGCASTGKKGPVNQASAGAKGKHVYYCKAHNCPGHANPTDRCGSFVKGVWVDKQ